MARSAYSGGTVTESITVEHTWGSNDTRVVVNVLLPGGHPAARLAMPADVMREVGQALIGAADQFDADDDVANPDDEAEAEAAVARMILDKVADDVDHRGATLAERQVLAALSGTEPRTPAQLKRRMPGHTPVATVRSLLGSLQSKGLATGINDSWVSAGAGVAHSDTERQASLEAAQAADAETAEPVLVTEAERAVYRALRVASGRSVTQIARHAGYSEGTTQAILEALEGQGYVRQYTRDALGTLWRLVLVAAPAPRSTEAWRSAYDHAVADGATHAQAVETADRAEAAVLAVRRR